MSYVKDLATQANATTATTFLVTLAAAPDPANTLILGAAWNGSGIVAVNGVTDNKGNAWVRSSACVTLTGPGGEMRVEHWYCLMDVAVLLVGDVVTVAFSAIGNTSVKFGALREYAGKLSPDAKGVTPTTVASTAVAVTTTAPTVVADEVVIVTIMTGATQASWLKDPAYSLPTSSLLSSSGHSVLSQYRQTTVAGTQTANSTLATSTSVAALITTFKATAVVGRDLNVRNAGRAPAGRDLNVRNATLGSGVIGRDLNVRHAVLPTIVGGVTAVSLAVGPVPFGGARALPVGPIAAAGGTVLTAGRDLGVLAGIRSNAVGRDLNLRARVLSNVVLVGVLDVVHDPDLDTVKITLSTLSAYDRVTLTRVGPSGVPAAVRAAVDRPVIAGVLVMRDYEAPLGVPLTYTADVWVAADPTSRIVYTATTIVQSQQADDPWLVDLSRPTNTQRIVLEHLDDLQVDEASAAHVVLGRRAPIVTSDVAQTPKFTVQFVTYDELAASRARAALGNGLPLLLRTPPQQGVGNLYLSTAGWHEQRLPVAAQALRPERRFIVTAQQVERPDATLFAPAAPVSYEAVLTGFVSYVALRARGTYDQVAYDFTIGQPSLIIPWPPSDV